MENLYYQKTWLKKAGEVNTFPHPIPTPLDLPSGVTRIFVREG